jgi:hypothetical protein
MHVKISSNWKTVESGYVKVAGAWKQAYTSGVVPPLTVDYLVLAGGGGGGDSTSGSSRVTGGGGGGAGGYRSSIFGELSGRNSTAEASLNLSVDTNYSLTVGAGGTNKNYGSNSVFSSITSLGGAPGGTNGQVGFSGGGSGGGGGNSGGTTYSGGTGTSGQGFDGGAGGSDNVNYRTGGGGGGAGGNGLDHTNVGNRGGGGFGLLSAITGLQIRRAGGGSVNGQSFDGGGRLGSNAKENTGGGGHGNVNPVEVVTGGPGGSGIVILSYPSEYVANIGGGLSAVTTSIGTKKVTTFTQGTGTISFSVESIPLVQVDYLVIGGGGSGGSGLAGQGGGGAGAYRSSISGEPSGGDTLAQSRFGLLLGTNYLVTVGGGGAGSLPAANTNIRGNDGSPSFFANFIAYGGGGGGAGATAGREGGSGGGGAGSTTVTRAPGSSTFGEGFIGGTAYNDGSTAVSSRGGGGGGAGGVGGNGTVNSNAGNGGSGITSSITGSPVARAGGGGGALSVDAPANGPGTANSGGGGGGQGTSGISGTPNTGGGGGAASQINSSNPTTHPTYHKLQLNIKYTSLIPEPQHVQQNTQNQSEIK